MQRKTKQNMFNVYKSNLHKYERDSREKGDQEGRKHAQVNEIIEDGYVSDFWQLLCLFCLLVQLVSWLV